MTVTTPSPSSGVAGTLIDRLPCELEAKGAWGEGRQEMHAAHRPVLSWQAEAQ